MVEILNNDTTKKYIILSKEEIVERYIRYTYEIGIIPGIREIDQCVYLCSYPTIRDKFGSLESLRDQCGIFSKNELSGKPLKSEIEKRLIRLRIERARRLDRFEILNNKELPNCDYIRKIYDNKSWPEIWGIIEKKIPDSMYYWKSK